MKSKNSNLLYYSSVILFIISLTQNAFFIDNKDGCVGYMALIFGFYVVLDTGISWVANLFIILSWAYRNKKASKYFSFLALVFGISFLFIDKIIIGTNNIYSKITGYGLGYYLWVLSFLLMFIRSLLNYEKIFDTKNY